MSGQRRPRRVSDNPWLTWGCEVPVFGCLFVGLAFLLACIVLFVADSPVFGVVFVIACLVVFGGLMGLGYVASKYNRR
jgi:hypothetical protein